MTDTPNPFEALLRQAQEMAKAFPAMDAFSPKVFEAMRISWLFIQFRLPFSVLISPLWASMRNGCASHHCGNVLVE